MEKHPFSMPDGSFVQLCSYCCTDWYKTTKNMRTMLSKGGHVLPPKKIDLETRLKRMLAKQTEGARTVSDLPHNKFQRAKRVAGGRAAVDDGPLELSRKRIPKEERAKRREISKRVVQELYEDQAGRCIFCKTDLDVYDVDHIVPISKGGDNRKINLQLLCKKCNSEKSDNNPAVYMVRKGIIDKKTLFILGYRRPR